ncbi:MAG: ribosomal subunit interface protein [Legionella sp.]|nr:MAG: ribosomal subunit interface protein [Legionella sp.]
MNIQISGDNIDLTDALKAHVRDKLTKLTQHFQPIIKVSVILTIEREQQIAEATVSITHFEAHARGESTDMYTSIDHMVDKLEKQLQKYKEKHADHRA